MKRTTILICCVLLAALAAFRSRQPAPTYPAGWPAPVYDFRHHPLDARKVALGRRLFYDPILSRDSTISCASCHSPYNSFTHIDHNLSHGIDGKIGTRNSPVLLNLAWSNSFMVDGAVATLDKQAVLPITNKVEMDERLDHVVQKLSASDSYREQFRSAYGRKGLSSEHMLDAISEFLLTLVSCHSKYDSVRAGLLTFNDREAKGYALFQQKCAACHKEPLFTSGEFENNGLIPDTSLNDFGRYTITHNSTDSLKFKVPTLRNIEFSAPYMHDGRFKTLSQVLNYYSMGIQHSPTLSPLLQHGLYLSSNEKVELISFLLCLSDKPFLYDTTHGMPPLKK